MNLFIIEEKIKSPFHLHSSPTRSKIVAVGWGSVRPEGQAEIGRFRVPALSALPREVKSDGERGA